MQWIGFLWDVVANAPKLISLVMAIMALIRTIKNPTEKATAIRQLGMAYAHAVETGGDSSQLNKVHDNLCSGVGCPPSLIEE